MPGFLCRFGLDITQLGGILTPIPKSINKLPTVFAEGLPVATAPCLVSTHPSKPPPPPPAPFIPSPPHIGAMILPSTTKLPTVFVEGKPVVTTGQPATCLHFTITGAKTIIAS